MNLKYIYSFVCIVLLHIFPVMSQDNTLSIPNVSIAQGQSINLPINVNNTADIVAVQFTLTVPDGISLKTGSAVMSERSVDHTVKVEEIEHNKYMVLAYSPNNKPFSERAGEIMSVNLVADYSLDENTEHPMALTGVVLSGSDGTNLATGFSVGKIKIEKSADLKVLNISSSSMNISPNSVFTVNWQVENIGGASTANGWSEQIFLEGSNGTLKLMGTVYNENKLAAGAIVSRSADITIPSLVTINGDVRIKVKLNPNADSGEPVWLRDNNSCSSEQVLKISKNLTLLPNVAKVNEAETKMIRFQLVRSGNTDIDEVFNISKLSDNRLKFPETVKITKGNSGVYFYAEVIANKKLDKDSVFEVSISGNNYTSAASKILLEDDTYPSLGIKASYEEVTEGKSIEFTISTENVSDKDIDIKLQSDYGSKFKIPSSITIPAGQSSVNVVVEALDDNTPNVDEIVSFTASADKYNKAMMFVELMDNDIPSLQLEINRNAVSEAAGPLAITAKLHRVNNLDKKITVKFTDDSDSEIHYGRNTIVMEKGVETVTFNLGPIDNVVVDGERTYNITASVWIASCNCNATSERTGGVVSVPLTIYDNDGSTLDLTSSTSILEEGGEMYVTVKRNSDTTQELLVNLSSDSDSIIKYLKTVTIPAGASSASFVVKSNNNLVAKDGFNAILYAEADGFSKANLWFTVSDKTLPDAQISRISLSSDKEKIGGTVDVSITLLNTGSYMLPEQTPVAIYINNSSEPAYNISLQDNLEPGDSVIIKRKLTLPDFVGNYKVHAVVNEKNTIKELNYTNNSSKLKSISAVSPYTVELNCDKKAYKQGEKVKFSGKIYGDDINGKEVELYIINSNYRHSINLVTDKHGAFETEYEPYSGQMGVFVAGACYPGENLHERMLSFDIYGIKRTTNSNITCELLLGSKHAGYYAISNPSSLPLTGVNVEIVSKPENCAVEVSCPKTVGPNSQFNVEYTITPSAASKGNNWEEVVLKLTTDEGLSMVTTVYYYCRNPKGELKASVTRINTTMIKDRERDYIFAITNVGKGETGNITLELPAWMTSVTPKEMPSLAYGDSATIILRLTPTKDMSPNVPVTGHIGINCTNGSGLSLPFYIEPVSKVNGTLIVDVCDENTYYTEEGPHVSGASVKVSHPTTGATISEGVTDANGIYRVILPEGYYSISVSEKTHNSYRNNILIDPGTDNTLVVNLSVQAISVDWDVVETVIEDEYSIVTTVNYETNVPVPVVKLNIPSKIEAKELAEGESLIFHATLTNTGLITAQDVELCLPNDIKNFVFEAMTHNEPFALAPQQSVLIPVKVTRISSNVSNKKERARGTRNIDNDPCASQVGTLYYWDCGNDRRWHRYEIALQLGTCRSDDPSTWDPPQRNYNNTGDTRYWPIDIPAPHLPSPNTGGTALYYTPDWAMPNITIEEDDGCEPCQNRMLITLVNCGLSVVPVYGCLSDAASCYHDFTDGEIEARDYVNCALGGIGCTAELCEYLAKNKDFRVEKICQVVGYITDVIQCLMNIPIECDTANTPNRNAIKAKGSGGNSMESDSPSNFIDEFKKKAAIPRDEMVAMSAALTELFGDEAWVSNTTMPELHDLLLAIYFERDSVLCADDFIEFKPEQISKKQLDKFIERFNNTNILLKNGALDSQTDNYIHDEIIKECYDEIDRCEKASQELGYNSTNEMWEAEATAMKKKLEEETSAVCASISLQISQKMVMTRQAFRGTLTVYNGNETTAMSDVRLTLTVTDGLGNVATSHEFQMVPEKLSGFEGELSLNAPWSLDAQNTGVAEILFIPTKYAAPTVEMEYNFGGQLSYVDPYTGLVVTRDLLPVTLTVKPSPNLDLTYFMQRDIRGDDPLTEEIEACEEAEFSLLINNIGNGDATDVRMHTEQPKIIDNEKGLNVEFELMSSQLNGKEKVLALGSSVATEIGTIPAQSSAYVQWWLKGSLLGHFVDYNVSATHVTSYGNPDLSLLNNVTIHELIRSIEVENNANPVVGFVTNDIPDINDTPDMIYLSNAEVDSVMLIKNASMDKLSATKYSVKVSAVHSGWHYGHVLDKTYGIAKIKSIVRQSDGKEIPLRNFWQTDCTLRDGQEPIYENRIHFVDYMTAVENEEYILEFEPTPSVILEVTSIEGIPEEGVLAVEPIQKVDVMFNKHIDPTTFTVDDINLTIQGKRQEIGNIGITTSDNKVFTLDFTEINDSFENGFYVLTVQTSDIKDTEGFTGHKGKNASWIMFREGNVQIEAAAYPNSAGTLDVKNAEGTRTLIRSIERDDKDGLKYGTRVKFVATQNEGYEFKNWTVNDEVVSYETEFDYIVLGDMEIVANYIRKAYSVEFDDSIQGGTIIGASTGMYCYGDTLELRAIPSSEYKLVGWIVDGQNISSEETLKICVERKMTVSASFERIIYEQKFSIHRGWNWISTYLDEAIPVKNIHNGALNIISQYDELIYDPELGMVGDIEEFVPGCSYKVNTLYPVTSHYKGYIHNLNDKPIVLKEGWNWVSYPYHDKRNLDDVLVNASDGDYISSLAGFAEYADGYWEGSLEELVPNEGYMYKSVSDKTLLFDFSQEQTKRNIKTDAANEFEKSLQANMYKYPSTMNIVARIYCESQEMDSEDYRIYALAGNECRGESKTAGENLYLTVHGDEPTEIRFVVESVLTGEIYLAEETLHFTSDVFGGRYSPYKITLPKTTGILYRTEDAKHMNVYNVYGILIKSDATMDYLKSLERGIYIIDGQKFIVR